MQHAHATLLIHAPIATVWPLIGDVLAVERWHPSVEKAELLSAKATGLDAARRCNFYDGTSVREDVMEIEDGLRLRLRLSEFKLPMKRLEAETRLQPTADGQTDATFAIHYEVKWGPFGRLLGATVMKRALKKMAARVLAGLGHHAETGERVGQGFAASSLSGRS